MSTLLNYQGYVIKKSALTDSQISAIKTDLTVTPDVGKTYQEIVKPKPFKIYRESEKYLFLPRYYGIKNHGRPDIDSLNSGEAVDFKFVKPLLDHQERGYTAMVKAMKEGNGGVFSKPCGGGKTAMAIKLASEISDLDNKKSKNRAGKTLVIVNKEDLVDQWEEAINKFTGGQARVGKIQREIVDVEDKDIVIGMLHSIAGKSYPKEVFDGFKLLIVDEVHHLGAEFFSAIFKKVVCRYNLGLSATPHRKDGLSKVFYYFLGDLFHKERREGKNTVLIKRIHLYSSERYYETQYMNGGKIVNNVAMINNLVNCPQRNKVILAVNRIVMRDPRRKKLTLSARREHLHTLDSLIKEARLKNKDNQTITTGFYYGRIGINRKKHRQMLDQSRKCDIILGTDNMAKEALDIPELNTLEMTTSSREIEQAVGRILRKYHDIHPIVIEYVDHCGNFPGQAFQRSQFYKQERYKIHQYHFELKNVDNEEEIEKLAEFLDSENQVKNEDLSTSLFMSENIGFFE